MERGELPARRGVRVVSMVVLAPGADGRVPGFDPVAAGLPRKNLKTMTRAVQLGVAAVSQVLAGWPAWQSVPPERRGLYVGASPQAGDPDDLAPALAALGGDRDLRAFADRAVPLIPPLWLVKGLSNNILGYASAQFDLQGDNGNWCDGRLGGAVALCNAVQAVAEGRVDLAVAGGADCLLGAEAVVGREVGEGAAFFVFVPSGGGVAEGDAPLRPIDGMIDCEGMPRDDVAAGDAELGAAAVPLALAHALSGDAREVRCGGLVVRRPA
ncbi:MAG: 3-oxoacyl-[acyl-carrier-protein] synthase 2 [Pseudomonadota bacterium]|jgi:hypothetical protein